MLSLLKPLWRLLLRASQRRFLFQMEQTASRLGFYFSDADSLRGILIRLLPDRETSSLSGSARIRWKSVLKSSCIMVRSRLCFSLKKGLF